MSRETSRRVSSRSGLHFVLLFGAVNLFADLTYEAARSVTGPFLATLVRRYSRAYWWYCASAGLVGFGFADYALLAHHFSRTHVVAGIWIPIFYSLSMAAGGLGSLVVGRLFDRVGLIVLLPVTLIGAVYAPLAFLGGFALALVGALLWGVGLGAHESVMQAAVAHMVSADRLGSVYGLFGAVFGIAWFIGSAALGAVCDRSVLWAVVLAVVAQLLAILPLAGAVRLTRAAGRANA